MVGLVGGILECSEYVFALKTRIVSKDFFEGSAGAQQFENVCYSDALPPDAGPAPAFAGFNGDPL